MDCTLMRVKCTGACMFLCTTAEVPVDTKQVRDEIRDSIAVAHKLYDTFKVRQTACDAVNPYEGSRGGAFDEGWRAAVRWARDTEED